MKKPSPAFDLTQYLSSEVHYPVSAREDCTQGIVLVKFFVNETGGIDSPSVLYPVDVALENEALRIVRSMPHWNPGSVDGQPAKVFFTLPITFKLLDCPSSADYYNDAVKLYSQGNIDDALKNFKTATHADYKNADALFNIAIIYIKNKETPCDACPYLKQIVDVDWTGKTAEKAKPLIAQYCSH